MSNPRLNRNPWRRWANRPSIRVHRATKAALRATEEARQFTADANEALGELMAQTQAELARAFGLELR